MYWTPQRLKELKEKGLKLTYEDRTKKPKKLTTTIPPKSGPQSEGLLINYNTVKPVRLEKINGRHRQIASKRASKNI